MKLKITVDKTGLSQLNLTPLWIGMIIGVMFALLTRFGLIPQRLLTPIPFGKIDIFQSVTHRLESIPNDFKLKNPVEIPPAVEAAGDYDNAAGYMVADFDTGEIIAEKAMDRRMPIASITKVMTAVVVLDLADPQELFTVRESAARAIPTKIDVPAGQKMSVEELLNAILLTSANDAAAVIKEGIDEKFGEAVFIKAMNKKAELIGLKNTHFENPQGFDSPQNYSTPEDLAILAHYAMKNYPLISKVAGKDYEFLKANANHKQFDLYNWNGLIGVYPNVTGLKIGQTGDAGKTTLAVAERGGKKMIAVVLGAPGVLERDMWAAELLDLGFERTAGLKAVSITEEELREKYATWQYF